jgi:hypothetical protein
VFHYVDGEVAALALKTGAELYSAGVDVRIVAIRSSSNESRIRLTSKDIVPSIAMAT